MSSTRMGPPAQSRSELVPSRPRSRRSDDGPQALLALQRSAGNAATSRLLGEPAAPAVQRLTCVVTPPGGKKVTIDTKVWPTFAAQVDALARHGVAALTAARDALVTAIGGDTAEYTKHLDHIDGLIEADRKARQAADELLAGEEKHKAAEARTRANKADKATARAQAQVRSAHPNLPSTVLDRLFALRPRPGADEVKLLSEIANVHGKAAPGLLDLALTKMKQGDVPVRLLHRVLVSSALAPADATAMLGAHAQALTESGVHVYEQALAHRGPSAGQVPAALTNAELMSLVLVIEAGLGQLQMASLDSSHPPAAVVRMIVARNLTADDVTKLARAAHIGLDVLSLCLADVRALSLVEIGYLDDACVHVRAQGRRVGAAQLATLATLISAGVPGLDAGLLARYVAGTILYPQLSAADLRAIIERNGRYADEMLSTFNARSQGCTATIVYGERDDLRPRHGGGPLWAPVWLGQAELHWEVVSDMLGWRGSGASHSGFTFAQLVTLRDKLLGSLKGPAVDHNEDGEIMLDGARVRVVVNRGQSKLITAFRV